MKTPDRDYFATAASAHAMFTKPGTLNKFDARWKRKNRIKQLKHTIERLNNESIANYFHGYNAGLQHGKEIGFLQGSKKLSEDILFQRKEAQQ